MFYSAIIHGYGKILISKTSDHRNATNVNKKGSSNVSIQVVEQEFIGC